MLKILIMTSVAFLALLGGLTIPVNASPPDTYSVGATSWDSNDIVGSSIIITVEPTCQEFPKLTAEKLEKARTALAVGNKLYYSESLRGKTVTMAIYMKEVFSEFPDFSPSIIYVKNLYQENQEIISYQPYPFRQ